MQKYTAFLAFGVFWWGCEPSPDSLVEYPAFQQSSALTEGVPSSAEESNEERCGCGEICGDDSEADRVPEIVGDDEIWDTGPWDTGVYDTGEVY